MDITTHEHEHHPESEAGGRACMSRRQVLLGVGGGALAVSMVAMPGLGFAAQAMKAAYPRKKIGTLSALQAGQPVAFSYPSKEFSNILVKLGTTAGGGVGPQADVVAFNQLCTHMGGSLEGTYKAQHQVLGPCPLHLTTFDLTRHGMVASGHGTESLPQILLEVSGDDIYAVGVMGLVYGRAKNVSA